MRRRGKNDFKQKKCFPCHFSASLAPLWGGERVVHGYGTGGAGVQPERETTACIREEAPQGGEVGTQGTGHHANSDLVQGKMAARMQGGQRGNLFCMGGRLWWPPLASC